MAETTRRPWCATVLAVCALVSSGRTARSEVSFSETLKGWSSLALQGPGRPVRDLRVEAGHLVLHLTTGSAAPVVAGGDVVGFFFQGDGSLEYTTDDPVERPVVEYNVAKNTALSAAVEGKALAIRDGFREVLWLSGEAAIPDLPQGAAGPALEAAFDKHRERFGRVQAPPLAQEFTARRLNGGEGPFVRAEIAGGAEDLLYALDAVNEKTESLYSLRKGETLPDRLYRTTLSSRPFGSDWRSPVLPRVMLTAVDFTLTASNGKDVALSVTETLSGLGRPSSVVLLHLDGTRFGRNSLDPRTLRVKGVFAEGGAPVPFDHAKDEIAIGLPAPLAPGSAVKLRFELEGDILYRPAGDSYWILGTDAWFPQPDLAGQFYTVHATAKVKQPFIPLMPGTTVRRAREGDWNVLETRVDRPVQFMVVLAGKYGFEEETKDGVTVRVASYAMKNPHAIRKLMNLTQKIIAFDQGFLGPFPFSEFNVIEINDLGWGQAPPGVMFITSEAFNPVGDSLNELYSKGINERFAHEIAHQYWGHVVKMPSSEEQWITESFAEICAGLVIRDLRGKSDFAGLQAVWKLRAGEVNDIAPIPLANRIRNHTNPSRAWTARAYLLYAKGPWLLNAVREKIGDQRFLVFLRSCQATLAWKFGTTEMIEKVLEAVTKEDWKPFFDANYWGTGMPT
jgi:Peptidase family M1 domain